MDIKIQQQYVGFFRNPITGDVYSHNWWAWDDDDARRKAVIFTGDGFQLASLRGVGGIPVPVEAQRVL
jgi:hypothetical protein